MSSHLREAGFTLIEVLVASAIVISTIGVILQLFSSGITGLHKSGSAQHFILAERQLYQALQIVDFTQQREQSGVVVGINYQWTATSIGNPYVIGANEMSSGVVIQLYNINVVMQEGDRKRIFEFKKLLHRRNSL